MHSSQIGLSTESVLILPTLYYNIVMSLDETQVIIEQIDSILRIQFNRPKKKNALSFAMYNAVTAALQQADNDPTIRVVYLTGCGGSFTAGNDLGDFLSGPQPGDGPWPATQFIKQISITETPIVAAVDGIAVGVGVTMLLHCDLVYASERSRFNFAFVDLGVVPEAASSYLLPRMVGQRRAAELLMLGEKFSAETAHEFGIANAVVSAETLQDFAWGKAVKLSKKPPQALHQTKQLLKRGAAIAVAETLEVEGAIFHERIQSAETRAIMMKILSR